MLWGGGEFLYWQSGCCGYPTYFSSWGIDKKVALKNLIDYSFFPVMVTRSMKSRLVEAMLRPSFHLLILNGI